MRVTLMVIVSSCQVNSKMLFDRLNKYVAHASYAHIAFDRLLTTARHLI